MKRLILAIALACVLSGLARAGEMHPTGAVPPPPPGTATVAGEIPTTGATTTGEIHSTGETVAGEIHTTGAVLTIILTLVSIR